MICLFVELLIIVIARSAATKQSREVNSEKLFICLFIYLLSELWFFDLFVFLAPCCPLQIGEGRNGLLLTIVLLTIYFLLSSLRGAKRRSNPEKWVVESQKFQINK